MCSPYLTGSLGVMLVLVSFNYWSISTQNYDLLTRIQQMQKQLATGTDNIKDLEKKEQSLVGHLQSKDSEVAECRSERNEYKKQITYQRTAKEKAEERLHEEKELKKSVQDDKDSLQTDVNRLTEEKDALQIQIDVLQDDIVKGKNRTAMLGKELEEIRAQYNQNRNLEELREEGIKVANKLGIAQGQLPDVDPAAVTIQRAKNQGIGLHILPLNGSSNAIDAGSSDNGAQVNLSKQGEKLEDIKSIHELNSSGKSTKSTSTTKKSEGLLPAAQVVAPGQVAAPLEVAHAQDKVDPLGGKVWVESVDSLGDPVEGVDSLPDLGDDPDQGSPLGQERVEREDSAGDVNPDKGEADNQRPLYENGPNGRDDLADDDQDPGGGNGDSLEDLAENLKSGDEVEKENHDDYDLGERTE